jgi:hypothetical protein
MATSSGLFEFADNASKFFVSAALLNCFKLLQHKFMIAQLSSRSALAISFLIACSINPCLANSITAESIWDQSNAEERARSQIPANATVISTNCETFQVRNDLRYRCTLEYSQWP